jgi:hypothetical protein
MILFAYPSSVLSCLDLEGVVEVNNEQCFCDRITVCKLNLNFLVKIYVCEVEGICCTPPQAYNKPSLSYNNENIFHFEL